jgi:hypothetical protein
MVVLWRGAIYYERGTPVLFFQNLATKITTHPGLSHDSEALVYRGTSLLQTNAPP